MQRQRSILSFFQKPSPATQGLVSGDATNGGGGSRFTVKEGDANGDASVRSAVSKSMDEVRGTDTPPEKVPRRVLPSGLPEVVLRLCSPILMHKFVKVDDRECSGERSREDVVPLNDSSVCMKADDVIPEFRPNNGQSQERDHGFSFSGRADVRSVEDDDVLGPETPGMRPSVSRLKRVLEDGMKFKENKVPVLDSNKRLKMLQDPVCVEKKEVNEGTKFEWLEPSRIRDANRRRPDDPLYDRKTLYLPADVFKKMSASQKQYWSGKFYELYELDAELGHKELDWKMTMSGVGNADRFKVGRIEQLETPDQAKARGANTVSCLGTDNSKEASSGINSMASTASEGNIGPDAVHLLAIKEIKMELEKCSTVYGFAFVDCAALRFWVGSISDDASCAALGALLMQVSPKEVVYDTVKLGPVPQAMGDTDAAGVRNMIESNRYFRGSSESWNCAVDGLSESDVALSALGELINHLSRLKLEDVLKHFHTKFTEVVSELMARRCPTGKRLLRNWICHPLKDVASVNKRLDIVEEFTANSEIVQITGQYLHKLPDLERLLGRIKSSVQSSASVLPALLGEKVLKQRVCIFIGECFFSFLFFFPVKTAVSEYTILLL
ncbi:unnamed protein product [Arabidopsis halleri]